MSKKRTLHSFFAAPASPAKKPRLSEVTDAQQDAYTETSKAEAIPPSEKEEEEEQPASTHPSYPCPIPSFPSSLSEGLDFVPATDGRLIYDQPDLDLLYYAPYIPTHVHRQLFLFLRRSLPFYRVKYTINRGSFSTEINTPRFTTVFGIDETSRFPADQTAIVDAATGKVVGKDKYSCIPRPLPACLEKLRLLTEATTGETFNFCLVNYYASGSDSISYHSDDERFLGTDPAIASFSLGATRDFLMKHKPFPPGSNAVEAKPLKLPLASGDMVLMRGRTQANWLHSIPKRKGGDSEKGRVNITFRKAMVKGGTENYYRYNVGTGEPYRWSEEAQEMVLWSEARS